MGSAPGSVVAGHGTEELFKAGWHELFSAPLARYRRVQTLNKRTKVQVNPVNLVVARTADQLNILDHVVAMIKVFMVHVQASLGRATLRASFTLLKKNPAEAQSIILADSTFPVGIRAQRIPAFVTHALIIHPIGMAVKCQF